MLYLVRPSGPLQWESFPTRSLLDAARKDPNIDLGRLDWKDAERPVTSTMVRLALRHGVACSSGIVLDPIFILDTERGAELRSLIRETKDNRAKLADSEQFMERLMPGWIEHGRELDARVEESTEESAKQADALAAKHLDAPVDAALLSHWISLGGRSPE